MVSNRSMWISCAVACSLFAIVVSQANNEYLPPNKGYNYDKPSIPFPTNNNGNQQPAPTFRPVTPTRPTYIPPEPTQGGGYPQNPNHESHDHSHDHGDHHHHEPGMPFDFAYSVDENGNDFSHNAISDGDVTKGEYRVALPDGRTQIVKYTADWKNGFNAEVTYEGEAKYPEQTSGYGRGPANAPSAPSGGQQYAPESQGGGYQY